MFRIQRRSIFARAYVIIDLLSCSLLATRSAGVHQIIHFDHTAQHEALDTTHQTSMSWQFDTRLNPRCSFLKWVLTFFVAPGPGAQTHAYREIVRTNFRYFVIIAITNIMMHYCEICANKSRLVQVDRVVAEVQPLKL